MRFGWVDAKPSDSHSYLLPSLLKVLGRFAPNPARARVIDIGCGNGVVTNQIQLLGFNVVGVEPSRDGVEQAKKAFPGVLVEMASAYDDLYERFGEFDIAVCLEVVEHLYSPHVLMRNIARLLKSGGVVVISTPYHGYAKNVVLSLAGKWDFHHHPLIEHGHIKFWSRASLERLVADAGLRPVEFLRLGRIPILAKSMMLVAKKI
jgi:2-polyprenyl-6-hydroxyphenyl methylase/3-demethylubiquinone-9 3-methyltransferase